MLAGRAYMGPSGRHSIQEYLCQVSKRSKWNMPPRVVEIDLVKSLFDFQSFLSCICLLCAFFGGYTLMLYQKVDSVYLDTVFLFIQVTSSVSGDCRFSQPYEQYFA